MAAQLAQAQTDAAAASSSAAGAATPAGDPPARVGRLASLSGTVSFHTADADHWDAATLNFPVTSGDAFWTEPQAAAAIEVGATHIALNEQTELDIDTLDDRALAATEPQGEIYVRIPSVVNGETYTVVTPRGSVAINGVGRFAIAAGDTDTPTTVTVVEGSAQVTGPNLSLSVGAHQTATITGTDNFQGSVGAESDDAFLTAQLQLEKQAPPLAAPATTATASTTATGSTTATAAASTTLPPVVQQMTGSVALQTQGDWSQSSEYGQVWYPPVQSGWVPYRDGHWAFVAPWGWTWVDNASWGFAPFHYGRWVEVGDRWGWTPGVGQPDYGQPVYAQPVYAPALVNFVGLGAAVAVGAAVGVAAGFALAGGFNGNIGWAPLGWRQPYIPPYFVSRPYLTQINQRYVQRTTLNNITNNYTHIYNNNHTVNNTVINNYYGKQAGATFNKRGATVVPAAAMVRSQPVAQNVVHMTPQQLTRARPLAAAPVRPTAQTRGVSTAVLQRVNPPAAQALKASPRAAAPGPAVRPMPVRAPGQPAKGPLPRPPLAPPPSTPRANQPARPAAAATASRSRPHVPPSRPHLVLCGRPHLVRRSTRRPRRHSGQGVCLRWQLRMKARSRRARVPHLGQRSRRIPAPRGRPSRRRVRARLRLALLPRRIRRRRPHRHRIQRRRQLRVRFWTPVPVPHPAPAPRPAPAPLRTRRRLPDRRRPPARSRARPRCRLRTLRQLPGRRRRHAQNRGPHLLRLRVPRPLLGRLLLRRRDRLRRHLRARPRRHLHARLRRRPRARLPRRGRRRRRRIGSARRT